MRYLIAISLLLGSQQIFSQAIVLEGKYGITTGEIDNSKKLMYAKGFEFTYEFKEKKSWALGVGAGVSSLQFNSSDSAFRKLTMITLPISVKKYQYFSALSAVWMQFGITNNLFTAEKKEIRSSSGKQIIHSSDNIFNMGFFAAFGYRAPLDPHWDWGIAVSDQKDLLFLNNNKSKKIKTATSALSFSVIRRL